MTGTAVAPYKAQDVMRQQVTDALINVAAGLGTGKAKMAGDRFVMQDISLAQCDAMYRSDFLSRNIVDMPVEDALKGGRIWQTKGNVSTAIEAAEKKWGTWDKLDTGMKLARLHGGAILLITVKGQEPWTPLTTIGKGQLDALTLLSRHEITPDALNRDPRSPNFRFPDYYWLNTGDIRTSARVHHSRVIRFPGRFRPDQHANMMGWDDSELQVVYSAIHQSGLVQTAIASMAHEAKNDIVGIKNLASQVATDMGAAAMLKRFGVADAIKSINNLILRDLDNETWERIQISFTGHPELIETYMMVAAAAARIPATKLWGKAPQGMNSTGEGDLQNYHERLKTDQNKQVRPLLEQIDKVIWQDATGALPPENAIYEFPPIKELSAKEKAEIIKSKAETLKIHVDTGALPSGENLFELVADQWIEDTVYPGLETFRAALRSDIASQEEERSTLEREAAAAPKTNGNPGAARDVRHFPRLPAQPE